MPGSDVELVTHGYTVSVRTAALGRIGRKYVMRDRRGRQIALPVATQPDHLLEVWTAFLRAAADNGPMPAMLSGEVVSSNPKAAVATSAVGARHGTTSRAA
jgi:hypothetical protein